MRNGRGWNRFCPTRPRVGVGGGRITAWCSTGCFGGPGVVSRGGMCRRSFGSWKTVYNRHRRWSGDGTWPGSSMSCVATPMWPRARTGRSESTAGWSAPISMPPVPATCRPPTSLRRSSRPPSWTQGGGSNDKKSAAKPSRESLGRSRGGLTCAADAAEAIDCAGCTAPLPPPAATGRPRRFCTPACRARAHRRRHHDAAYRSDVGALYIGDATDPHPTPPTHGRGQEGRG